MSEPIPNLTQAERIVKAIERAESAAKLAGDALRLAHNYRGRPHTMSESERLEAIDGLGHDLIADLGGIRNQLNIIQRMQRQEMERSFETMTERAVRMRHEGMKRSSG